MKALKSILIFSTALLAGCSVYQSEGRKFLEKSAFEFAGVAAYVTACDNLGVDATWVKAGETAQTETFVNEDSEEFRLKVLTTNLDGDSSPYGCEFRFPSAQELVEKSENASGYTLATYNALPKTR